MGGNDAFAADTAPPAGLARDCINFGCRPGTLLQDPAPFLAFLFFFSVFFRLPLQTHGTQMATSLLVAVKVWRDVAKGCLAGNHGY